MITRVIYLGFGKKKKNLEVIYKEFSVFIVMNIFIILEG